MPFCFQLRMVQLCSLASSKDRFWVSESNPWWSSWTNCFFLLNPTQRGKMFVFTLRSQERRYVALHSSHIDSMNFMMLYQNHSEYQWTILHFLSQTVRDLPKLNQVAGCRCVVMNGDRLTLRILGWKWELHSKVGTTAQCQLWQPSTKDGQ